MNITEQRQWLEQRAPEVNYSTRILAQELRAQRGYAGCGRVRVSARAERSPRNLVRIQQHRRQAVLHEGLAASVPANGRQVQRLDLAVCKRLPGGRMSSAAVTPAQLERLGERL